MGILGVTSETSVPSILSYVGACGWFCFSGKLRKEKWI